MFMLKSSYGTLKAIFTRYTFFFIRNGKPYLKAPVLVNKKLFTSTRTCKQEIIYKYLLFSVLTQHSLLWESYDF